MHAEDHFDDDFLMPRLFEFGYPVTRYEAEIYPLAMALR